MSIRITRVSHRKLNSGIIKSGEAAAFGGEFGVWDIIIVGVPQGGGRG